MTLVKLRYFFVSSKYFSPEILKDLCSKFACNCQKYRKYDLHFLQYDTVKSFYDSFNETKMLHHS